jgi:CubicO group peptidase (beta-lactamase class C family)
MTSVNFSSFQTSLEIIHFKQDQIPMRLRLILLPLILLMSCWLCSQPSSATQQESGFAELEKVALEELQETETPGAAVAVVSGERVVVGKGFGESNVETHAHVKPEMLFRLGAPTKVLTAAVLVMLAEEGKIRLDEPIGAYVKGLSPKIAQVTTHQLLTHTAGLKDESPMYGRHDESALADTVRSWKDDYFVSGPGQKFSHSNPGYWLAGFVVEQLTGKPFADQLKERLFDPLGMSNTTFRPTIAMTFPIVTPYFTLYTFGVTLAAAYLASLWWLTRSARREGLDPDRVASLGL